jgi:hypothetical protein
MNQIAICAAGDFGFSRISGKYMLDRKGETYHEAV